MRKKPTSHKEIVAHLVATLNTAHSERPERDYPVRRADGTCEQCWIGYEREIMLDEVNMLRRQRELAPITETQLRDQAEDPAVGSGDYTQKFALYAANLVHGTH